MSWWEICIEHLRERRRRAGEEPSDDDVEKGYRIATNQRLGLCASSVFFDRLLDHLAADRLTRATSVAELARYLRVDRSTVGRWRNRECFPDPSTYFLYLLEFGVDVGDVQLPGSGEAVTQCLMRAVETARFRDLGRAHKQLAADAFYCVSRFYALPDSHQIVASWSGLEQNPDATRMLERVAESVRSRHPESGINGPPDVVRVLSDWLLPYALFQFGRPGTWRFLDEDAA